MDKKWMTIPLLIFLLLITQGCTEENGENGEYAENGEEAEAEDDIMYRVEIDEDFKQLLETYPEEEVKEGTQVRFALKEDYEQIFEGWIVNGEDRGQGMEIPYTVEEDLVVEGAYEPFLHIEDLPSYEQAWGPEDEGYDQGRKIFGGYHYQPPILQEYKETLDKEVLLEHFTFDETEYILAKEKNPGDGGNWIRRVELVEVVSREEQDFRVIHSAELSDFGRRGNNPDLTAEVSNNHRYLYITIDYLSFIAEGYPPNEQGEPFVPEENFLQVFDLKEGEIVANHQDLLDQPLSTYNLVPLGEEEMILASDNKGWWRINPEENKGTKLEIGGPYRHTEEKVIPLETLGGGRMFGDSLFLSFSSENIPMCGGYSNFHDLWHVTDQGLELLATTGEMIVLEYDDEREELRVIGGTQEEPEVIIYEVNEPVGDQGDPVTKIKDLDKIDFFERKKTFEKDDPLVGFDEGGFSFTAVEFFPSEGYGMILTPSHYLGRSNYVYTVRNEEGEWERLHLPGMENAAKEGDRVYLKTEEGIFQFDRTELIEFFHEALGMEVEKNDSASGKDT
ncbi:hypothetical protein [Isachenkonia alkalipeptolytica]|uniref:Uncharacterized protein n=1 Tax=Isachenkonia alkalipeptolytica TaxID=2565777 RepID=A0AA43XKU8_9CLOT|nr:hypothetical protein [Isachenkonia alkalipeptolytica]NBG87710.1 hypothetical protein [Isachenkonia alkalipeptolytica]